MLVAVERTTFNLAERLTVLELTVEAETWMSKELFKAAGETLQVIVAVRLLAVGGPGVQRAVTAPFGWVGERLIASNRKETGKGDPEIEQV